MQYRTLGRTGMRVSPLCLGTMTFGWTADEQASFAMMDAAREAGINFFDTADMYSNWSEHSYSGKTEEIIGRWLAQDPSRRETLVLATKVRGPMAEDPNEQGLSRRHIVRSIERSLRRLQTDYVDLYQSHWFDDDTAQEETLRAYEDLISSGKVRAIGCSNFKAWQLMEALGISERLGLARYETLQPHYNLVHRAEFERELLPLCRKYDIAVIPYSPLAGGFLSGKYRRGQGAPEGSRGASSAKIQRYMERERNYDLLERMAQLADAKGATVSQIALAWTLSAPAITAPIIGANSVEQLRDNLGALAVQLSADEQRELAELSAWDEER